MNKTTLIINEFAAADKLEEEMKRFGLEVDRGTFTGTYPGNTTDLYNVCVYTKKYPIKGNKKLIEELEARGYCVRKYLGIGSNRHYVFRVCKTYLISTTKVAEPVAEQGGNHGNF